MTQAAADRCPRCGAAFHCGIGDAGPCPCTTVTLSAALQQQLRERYQGCLCLHCLRDCAAGAAVTLPAMQPENSAGAPGRSPTR